MIEKDRLLIGQTVWVRMPSMLFGGYEDHRGVVSEILYDGSINVVRYASHIGEPRDRKEIPIAYAQREILEEHTSNSPVWGFFLGGSKQWLRGINQRSEINQRIQ